jgi:hypothetical protein
MDNRELLRSFASIMNDPDVPSRTIAQMWGMRHQRPSASPHAIDLTGVHAMNTVLGASPWIGHLSEAAPPIVSCRPPDARRLLIISGASARTLLPADTGLQQRLWRELVAGQSLESNVAIRGLNRVVNGR